MWVIKYSYCSTPTSESAWANYAPDGNIKYFTSSEEAADHILNRFEHLSIKLVDYLEYEFFDRLAKYKIRLIDLEEKREQIDWKLNLLETI